VVALTKIDLAAGEQAAREQVREKLLGTVLEAAPIVATSVVTGRGIEELKSALAAELSRTPTQRDIGRPRLAIDRIFTMRGTGTIVTGTLTGGTLRRGQGVLVQPGAKPARIRTVQSYGCEVEQATPGSRVALNLPDLQTAEAAHGSASVSRGDVVTLSQMGQASDTADTLLEMSARSAPARSIKDGAVVRLHHGSGNFPATVHLLGAQKCSPGQRVLAEFRFESPLFAFAGDRFIVRDWSEQHTLAGGIILDPDASRRGFRSEPRRQFLQDRADHPQDVMTLVTSDLARAGVAMKSALLMKSRHSADEIGEAVLQLASTGKAVIHGETVANATWWQGLMRSAVEAIGTAHESHPEEPGLKLTDLRQSLSKKLIGPDVFEALLHDLSGNGFVRTGAVIRRADHRPALPPLLQPAGAKLRAHLTAKPLEPASRKELTPDALSQQAMRFLLQTGEAIEISNELVLHADPYERAIQTIRGYIQTNGSASVSELKQALNTSRRVMVPLLEKLDREGITRRVGDKRVLGRSA
jgi:selenocysteine-specific elongation factor